MKVIHTPKAPAAIGPYSQGKDIGNLVFTSGQLPINPETKVMATDIKEATKNSMENCKAILEEAGTDLSKVIKTTVFMKDLAQFADFNEVYATYFEGEFPARSCVEVARLPKDVLLEIEAIAVK